MTYSVRVDDNYHYMDPSERYTHGTFDTLEEALKAARQIVDSYLASAYAPGMAADKLYHSYTTFGDDPFIIGPGKAHFSAWDYARARCAILCAVQPAT
jgi:hypothetical protein